MVRNLDHFRVYVRKCQRIEPDGYEVVLEIRRRPVTGEAVHGKPGPKSPHIKGESEVAK
jgi:hypothetical protein